MMTSANPLFRFFLYAIVLAWPFVSVPAALAQNRNALTFIRDAEIEHYLRSLANPVFKAADINPKDVNIHIINSPDVNAFVAQGMNMFFFTGLLQLTETPEQLVGVIAHETGHIAGGHLIRGREAMANASAEAILGVLLGVAAGVVSGKGDVAVGAISGSHHIAERNLLRYSRAQESSADLAALSYLDRAGMSSRGMKEFMVKLGAQDILPIDRQVEYARTHPLSQSRVDTIKHHLHQSRHADAKLDPKFAVMHDRMKAKLIGFLQPDAALLRYTDKDPRIAARYARAIALYRNNQLERAIAVIDGLIKDEPSNPFFTELKAQMLFENGRIGESVALYKNVVEAIPDSSILRQSYGHALLESKTPEAIDEAIRQLTEANRLEPRSSYTWRFLAAAWGKKGEITNDPLYNGYAAYALAEEAASQNEHKTARQYAERATKMLPKGSPYWLRAQDIKQDMDNIKDK